MGNIYDSYRQHLGYCEDGIIYNGRTPIGRYENGNIYNHHREHVGSYAGGSIYNRFREYIASYDNGLVYNKYWNIAVGREQIGSYDGDPAAAAALVLLFLGESTINGREQKQQNDRTTPADKSRNDDPPVRYSSDDGGILTTIVAVLFLILRMLWVAVKVVFFFILMNVISFAWIGWLAIIAAALAMFLGLFPVAFPLAVIPFVLNTAFQPYWIMTTWRKITKKLTWGDMLRHYVKWFKRGPAVVWQVCKMAIATFKKQSTWQDVWHYCTTWMMDD